MGMNFSVCVQENEFCATTASPNILQLLAGQPKINTLEGDIYIRLYPHIVMEAENSTNVRPFFDVYTAIEILKEDFEPYGIYFDVQCYDVLVHPEEPFTLPVDLSIYDFDITDGCDETADVSSLISTNAHDDGIDDVPYVEWRWRRNGFVIPPREMRLSQKGRLQ